MHFDLNAQSKYCEYQFYTWCSLILFMYVICRGPPLTFPSSNASCDAIPNVMMVSRGFASRCVESEYTHLESNWFREAILGSRHTYKNTEEFQNANLSGKVFQSCSKHIFNNNSTSLWRNPHLRWTLILSYMMINLVSMNS